MTLSLNPLGLMSPSEKIEARENKRCDTHHCEKPEEKALLFHHPQIDQKESKSVKGMEDKAKQKEEVQGSILMEFCKPGTPMDSPDQGKARENFQSHQNEKQRTAESNKVVRNHIKL